MANKKFSPRLDILPTSQRELWPLLKDTPEDFTLYGGTALALRLGHRQSVDFDFFSNKVFDPDSLIRNIPYLKEIEVQDVQTNTLTGRVRDVQISYFGMKNWKNIEEPDIADGPEIKVATLIDLAGTKVAVVQKRASWKDYVDIHAILSKTDISLEDALVAGRYIYGKQFNPIITLKALSYYKDVDLEKIPESMQIDLKGFVREIDPSKLEHIIERKDKSRQVKKKDRSREIDR